MLGGNLPENRPFELQLFNNSEVIAVNQNGDNPHELYKNGGASVWYSHVQNSKDIYVALFNLSDANGDVAVSFAALGLGNKVKVRDLWRKQDLGRFKKAYHQLINKHGAALLRLSKK